MKHKPSILDNIKHWQVFEDYQQLKKFIELMDDFFVQHIDQDEDVDENPKDGNFQNTIANHKFIELRGNFFPKGLSPLEIIFDNNDVPIKPVIHSTKENVIGCNIKTKQEPKFVKISTSLYEEKINIYVELIKESVDVFSWKYEYLKIIDTNIIQHKIPLKPSTKPSR